MSATGKEGWRWSSVLGQLVGAIFGVLRLEAVVAHESDGDGLKELSAHRVLELKHLGVVVAGLEQRGNAKQHRVLHRQEGHNHLQRRRNGSCA